ncbi:transporter [Nakamurella flava]|uniref:Transporter n=1 Tax=Nakamurella flava TaxID=2576308 RepID=A0A4U6QMA8_9ACTN|nr:transporter [Nakamurella flava]TKV61541.1 transporter [Nakamurella flava]
MERLLLTLAMVVFVALAFWGLYRGWQHRAQRQADIPALPAVPAETGDEMTPPLAGVYVSTTRSGSWQDRIVAQGLGVRDRALVRATPAGVLIDRENSEPLFLPRSALRAIGTAPGIAGKVMGQAGGVLLLTWDLDGTALDSGVRADDPDEQQTWLQAARTLLPTTPQHTKTEGEQA